METNKIKKMEEGIREIHRKGLDRLKFQKSIKCDTEYTLRQINNEIIEKRTAMNREETFQLEYKATIRLLKRIIEQEDIKKKRIAEYLNISIERFSQILNERREANAFELIGIQNLLKGEYGEYMVKEYRMSKDKTENYKEYRKEIFKIKNNIIKEINNEKYDTNSEMRLYEIREENI